MKEKHIISVLCLEHIKTDTDLCGTKGKAYLETAKFVHNDNLLSLLRSIISLLLREVFQLCVPCRCCLGLCLLWIA